ncbi:MAG TPA: hypothetical protein VME47_13780 [Acetobacteraceae bacterium]|nr:hypothetical protein [Acetobacteraceae bacterium]
MSDLGADLNECASQYYGDDGTRKPLTYWIEYDRVLRDCRGLPVRILELGVASGASLLTLRDYMPHATIVGIDTCDCPARVLGQKRIHFIQGSQEDSAILDRAGQLAGNFDLIIDDASHIGYVTKRSFCHLFPRWLVAGGWYAIEDFGTGFLPEYPDGAGFRAPPPDDAQPATRQFESHQFGMVGVVKQILDYMMQELMTGTHSFLDVDQIVLRPNIAVIHKAIR